MSKRYLIESHGIIAIHVTHLLDRLSLESESPEDIEQQERPLTSRMVEWDFAGDPEVGCFHMVIDLFVEDLFCRCIAVDASCYRMLQAVSSSTYH